MISKLCDKTQEYKGSHHKSKGTPHRCQVEEVSETYQGTHSDQAKITRLNSIVCRMSFGFLNNGKYYEGMEKSTLALSEIFKSGNLERVG